MRLQGQQPVAELSEDEQFECDAALAMLDEKLLPALVCWVRKVLVRSLDGPIPSNLQL